MPSRRKPGRRRTWFLVVLVVVAALGCSVYLLRGHGGQKPVIIYVNQGNGVVNGSKFGTMLDYASSDGFNTIFFQVYRQDYARPLLFPTATLRSFVNQTHQDGMKIFFAIYVKNASITLPATIFGLHEDGISLDLSNLDPVDSQTLLNTLKSEYSGHTAVTTFDQYSALRPDILVLETYTASYRPFIKPGVTASVEVVAMSSEQDYQSQFQYALQNSDGVMVFDYAALSRAGY